MTTLEERCRRLKENLSAHRVQSMRFFFSERFIMDGSGSDDDSGKRFLKF